MIRRILLAVDDSAASLAAAHAALDLAAATGATVHVLHVIANNELATALRAASCTGVPSTEAADLLLARTAELAAAGVPVHTEWTVGDPARCVLDHARSWPADLVVLGRANRRGPGQPHIGQHTQHILEFAEWPVLTVPPPPDPEPSTHGRFGERQNGRHAESPADTGTSGTRDGAGRGVS